MQIRLRDLSIKGGYVWVWSIFDENSRKRFVNCKVLHGQLQMAIWSQKWSPEEGLVGQNDPLEGSGDRFWDPWKGFGVREVKNGHPLLSFI